MLSREVRRLISLEGLTTFYDRLIVKKVYMPWAAFFIASGVKKTAHGLEELRMVVKRYVIAGWVVNTKRPVLIRHGPPPGYE